MVTSEEKRKQRKEGGARGGILQGMISQGLSDKRRLREIKESARGTSEEEHYRQLERQVQRP